MSIDFFELELEKAAGSIQPNLWHNNSVQSQVKTIRNPCDLLYGHCRP